MGHIGDDIDPKGGEDPTLYGWRAAVESARFSKYVAQQVYGGQPHHAYVWGGSGGGRRSPLCLENAPDVFDGALPFMGGGDVRAVPGDRSASRAPRSWLRAACSTCSACCGDGDKHGGIIDAMQPGRQRNPFEGLTRITRGAGQPLPPGIPARRRVHDRQPMGQIWLWSSIADLLHEQDPSYFEDFWTKPGYVGHDLPVRSRTT